MANNNRQYRRKLHQKVDSMPTSFSDGFGKIIKILIVIAIVLVVFYFLTVFILKRGDSTTDYIDTTPSPADIQYQEILAGNSFSQGSEHYFVLFFDMSDENVKSLYTSFVTSYEGQDDHFSIYTVDTSSSFNKKYVADTSNPDVSNIDNLKVNGPTLIEFEDGKVIDYIEGQQNIQEKLS